MSTAYTIPLAPTRRAARTVNHPEPAPISATVFPGRDPQKVHHTIDLQPLIPPRRIEDRKISRVRLARLALRGCRRALRDHPAREYEILKKKQRDQSARFKHCMPSEKVSFQHRLFQNFPVSI